MILLIKSEEPYLRNKVLGYEFLEKVYGKALMIELRSRGLSVENQVPLKVSYKEQIIGEYFANLLVEGRVIVEIKTVTNLLKEHQAQLLNFLKATGIQVGLLVNFTRNKKDYHHRTTCRMAQMLCNYSKETFKEVAVVHQHQPQWPLLHTAKDPCI
jgi:GxxExxY protein